MDAQAPHRGRQQRMEHRCAGLCPWVTVYRYPCKEAGLHPWATFWGVQGPVAPYTAIRWCLGHNVVRHTLARRSRSLPYALGMPPKVWLPGAH
eukprot:1159119-Pelagomonas_calceolata.AAC.5